MKKIYFLPILVITLASCFSKGKISSTQVNSIKVQHVPDRTTEGGAWDVLGDRADIQIRISHNGTVMYRSETYEEASSNNTYFFKKDTPFLFDAPNDEYRIDLYDYDDLSSDDWIGGFTFRPMDYAKKSEITLTSITTPIAITILVDWNYTKK
jgi:hypothetical protein